MRYIKPIYAKETIETKDIILTSPVVNENVVFEEVSTDKANVKASIFDILGISR